MLRVVPCITDSLEFMQSSDWIARESSGHMADSEYAQVFKEYRGSRSDRRPDLPWRDVDRSILVVINKTPGADVAIALDFRTSNADPRVIASAWQEQERPAYIDWVEVAPTFTAFLREIGMYPDA
jgi:hypothetical protein